MSEEQQQQQQPTPTPTTPPKSPIQHCEETMAEANRRLMQQNAAKHYTIPSNNPSSACTSEGCDEVQIPELRPCFELRWGDGPNDQIETDDLEVLCIVASNPYTNIVLKDVTIILTVITQDGAPVPMLPDGTPSVSITPSEFICFGDLPPCQDGEPGGVAREVVLMSRGAKAGPYAVSIEYCFAAELLLSAEDEFRLDLITS